MQILINIAKQAMGDLSQSRSLFPYLALVLFLFMLQYANALKPERSTYIVRIDKTHMPNVFDSHHNWYSSIIESLKPENPEKKFIRWWAWFACPHLSMFNYDNALHCFSASLSVDEYGEIQKATYMHGSSRFIGIARNATLDTTHTTDFLSLSLSHGLWLPSSNFGDDVTICFIDS